MGVFSKFLGQIGVSGNFNNPAYLGPTYMLEPVVAITAANTNLVAAAASTWYTVAPAAATQINLPVPLIGVQYTFVVTTSATGTNTLKWLTDSASTFIQGTDIIATVGGASTIFQGNGTSHRSFNCNGTTTGGLIGTTLTFTALTTTSWQVTAQNFGSGSLATSFGTS